MSSYYTGRAPPRSRYSVPSGAGTSSYGSDWSTNPGSGSGTGISSSSRYTPKSYTSGLTPASYSHGHSSSYDRSGSGTSSPSHNPYLSSATKGSTASSYLNSYSSLPRSYSSPSRRDGTGVGGSTGIRNYGTSGSPTSSSSASASNKSSSYYPSPSSVTGSYLLGHYSVGPVVQTTSALQAYYNRQAAAAKGATPTSTSTAGSGSGSGSVSAGSGSSAVGVGNRDRPYSNTGLTGSNSFGAYDSKSRRRAPSPEYIQTKQRQLQNKEGAYVERRGITPGPGTGSGLGSGLGSGTGRQNCDVVLTNKNNNNSSNNTKNNLNSSKSGLASHRTSRTDINQVPPAPTVPPPTNNNNNNNVNNNEKKSYKKSLSKRLSASLSSLVFSIGSSRSLSNSKLSSPSTENLDHGEFDDDSYSDSVGSGKVSELSYDYNQGAADPNSISDNGVSSRTNYRKLYEGIFKENELLKSCLTRYEKEVDQLKFKLSRLYDQQQQAAQTPPKTSTGSEKKAKRTLEVKMEAMELELRQVQKLKLENENIRAENRALTRVVSKLSSKSLKGSS